VAVLAENDQKKYTWLVLFNDRYGGLVVYQDKSGSTFSEHCKSLKKLSMLMSAIVSKLSFLT